MKGVLIISNYFPPEMGAASNRIFQMAKGLSEYNEVTVICPYPNYPTGKIFKNYKSKKEERIDNMTVKRLWIYPSNSANKLIRLFSMLSFSLSVFWFILWNKIPKTVVINSPPLLVAFTSLFILSNKKHKLILNVSDLWPRAGFELGAIKEGIGYKLLLSLERYNYKKASVILGQSEEILSHVRSITTDKEFLLYRNFPDFEPPKLHPKSTSTNSKIKLVYAGLLGVAQGVFRLCEELDFSNIEFHIYGSGSDEKKLKQYLKDNPNLPITMYGSIKREKLHQELLQYDVAIIPLLNRIYGSVPSKIFEFARLGLPILYFGGGEGETIIQTFELGLVAEAGNYHNLNGVINSMDVSNFSEESKLKIQKTAIESFDASLQLKKLQSII